MKKPKRLAPWNQTVDKRHRSHKKRYCTHIGLQFGLFRVADIDRHQSAIGISKQSVVF